MKSKLHAVELVGRSDEKLREFAIQLAKKNRDELGAVHCGVISGIVEAGVGVLRVSRENDEPASMILTRNGLASDTRCMPIIAAAVSSDARRLKHGLALVDAVADEGFERGRSFVQAICREDLPSNRFWLAAGFTPIARRTNKATRRIPCVVWRRQITDMSTSLGFIGTPLRAQGGGGRFVRLGDVMKQLLLFEIEPVELSNRHVFDQTFEGLNTAADAMELDPAERRMMLDRFSGVLSARC